MTDRRVIAAIEALRARGVSDSVILDMVQAMLGVESDPAPMPVMPVAVYDESAERRRAAERERARARRAEYPDNWYALRARIFARDGYACTYCGQVSEDLHCDHIVPFSRGGATTEENLTTACASCNSSKGARLISEWRGQQ